MFTNPCLPVKSFLSCAAIVLLTLARAEYIYADEIEVQDPKGELQKFAFASPRPEFSQAFTCMQNYWLFTQPGQCKISCEFGVCKSTCAHQMPVETRYTAEDCTSDPITFYPSLGGQFSIQKSDYTASKNSMVLPVLKYLWRFFEQIEVVRIEHISPVSFRKGLIENGKLTPLQMTVIEVTVFPLKSSPYGFALRLGLDLNRSGLDQVMCLSEHGLCDPNQDYLLKRKGLVNANF